MDERKFNQFWVFGGMGGGFGGPHFLGTVEGVNIDAADVQEDARSLLVDEYESYAGYHGIPTWDETRADLESSNPDDEITDEDVDDAYNQEIDSWGSVWVIPAVEGEDPEDEKWLETAPWKQIDEEEEE